jgi:hypothetical protein
MRKTFQLVPIQFLIFVLAFAIFPSHGNSQSNTASVARDTFNIGFAVYTKGAKSGTLNAIWNYANVYSGKGTAIGVTSDGFAGRYHVKYYLENGEFSDEYDLIIERVGDFYNLSWITDGKISARGVGMEVDNHLAAGWRRITD